MLINAIPRRQFSVRETKNPQKKPFADGINGKCETDYCEKVIEMIKSDETSKKCSSKYFLNLDIRLPENRHVSTDIDTETEGNDDTDNTNLRDQLKITPHLDALFQLLGGFVSSYGRTTISGDHLKLPTNFNNITNDGVSEFHSLMAVYFRLGVKKTLIASSKIFNSQFTIKNEYIEILLDKNLNDYLKLLSMALTTSERAAKILSDINFPQYNRSLHRLEFKNINELNFKHYIMYVEKQK